MTRQVFISDTNIWIDFRHAGLLNTLFQLPFALCSTDFVAAELQDFDMAQLRKQGLQIVGLDAQAMPRLLQLMAAHNNSSLADVSCYLLAKDTGHPLLTGDGRLRRQAQQDGLRVYGALWLLDQLVEHGVAPPAEALRGLLAMLAAGARLPDAECQARLVLWTC